MLDVKELQFSVAHSRVENREHSKMCGCYSEVVHDVTHVVTALTDFDDVCACVCASELIDSDVDIVSMRMTHVCMCVCVCVCVCVGVVTDPHVFT